MNICLHFVTRTARTVNVGTTLHFSLFSSGEDEKANHRAGLLTGFLYSIDRQGVRLAVYEGLLSLSSPAPAQQPFRKTSRLSRLRFGMFGFRTCCSARPEARRRGMISCRRRERGPRLAAAGCLRARLSFRNCVSVSQLWFADRKTFCSDSEHETAGQPAAAC
jgi:hypothetical protein